MRARRSCTLVAVAVAVLAPAWVRAQAPPIVLDAIVATVNGDAITASDVRAVVHLAWPPGRAVADPVAYLVDRALMLDEVERAAQGLPPAEQVDARRRELEAALGPTALAQLAARDAVTAGRLAAWVRDDLRIEAYVTQRFTAAAQPTDEEVASYFAANATRFVQPGTVADDAAMTRARTALVESRRQALIDAWLDGLRRRADIVSAPR